MPEYEFTEDEILVFLKRFNAAAGWQRWERTSGTNGRDLISVHTDAGVLRLAKSEQGGFMAAGFGDWGLVVCETFVELLDALTVEAEAPAKVA